MGHEDTRDQKGGGRYLNDAKYRKYQIEFRKKLPRAYGSWADMKKRVLNPLNKEYQRYKGRHIDPRWMIFANFYADMGERPEGLTLERIDNTKGYGPDNCKWATRVAQARNTHNTEFHKNKISAIREMLKNGICGLEIARKLEVSGDIVYNVKHGRTWAEVANV